VLPASSGTHRYTLLFCELMTVCIRFSLIPKPSSFWFGLTVSYQKLVSGNYGLGTRLHRCAVLVYSQFIDQWKKRYASEVWCENVRTKEKKRLWRRKDSTQPFAYPWKEQRTTTLPQN